MLLSVGGHVNHLMSHAWKADNFTAYAAFCFSSYELFMVPSVSGMDGYPV